MKFSPTIDDLPEIVVDFGSYKPETSVVGVDDESIQEQQKIKQQCLTTGYLLSKENVYADCETICNVKEVTFKYFPKSSNAIIGNKKIEYGSYCVPTDAANCNDSTSTLVYGLTGWNCLPRISAFGGIGGNKILICDGRLQDNGLNIIYDTYIPSNLKFNDLYEDKLADDSYRFTCVEKKNSFGNSYLYTDFDRLQIYENWCASDIPYSAPKGEIKWNFQTQNCFCDNFQTDTTTQKCTACKLGLNENSFLLSIYPQYCYSEDDTVDITKQRLESLKGSNRLLLPCGSDELDSEEFTRPRCVDLQVSAFPKTSPSHNTMKILKP
ncbi:uncharacterized protein LOC122859991 [Aphidius gifuensis]|uniref:uncharacterized protein LOC122859991 n=1 Tax=Aphidius gifuensis TaxID=684658 RepID=UPI001CDB5758|nr:uncharacterized protein LOC122859991 [Aphidius gifuensis]